MDFAVAQLALIFLPGLIWGSIDAKYGSGAKATQTVMLIRSFAFGLASYSVLFVVYLMLDIPFGYDELPRNIAELDLIQLRDEIAFSIPVAFILSIVWLWVVRLRWLARFLNWCGASRRYGDEDVWSFALNSSIRSVEYLHLRDLQGGFVYAGWINVFSETEEYRELLLRDAIVYDLEGEEISRAPFLYLSRPKQDIWIEFPIEPEGT
ncbi:hypothetical protein EU805_03085 [Salipiger sp. IMCC34102]|uniref:DUF6338 family protein n=1 Tax=Salipiger sp. IMCC34102 TaxID=2510647 RepID=UPI00101D6585|nr:DUF6338 family protein [Salipiger sp. IMCC34102]RYH04368.1 hypothetical protein EU805_03085 [Salipiger sp. IMCC34102]